MFALLNVAFLVVHCAPGERALVPTACLIGGLATAWWALRLIGSGRRGNQAFAATLVSVLFLFILHKAAPSSAILSYQGISKLWILKKVMLAVGFSYVALRMIDAARVIKDGRCIAPDFLSTINYLVPFHMLAAGPIQSFEEFASQPAIPEPLGLGRSLAAVERIVSGLFKKFVLANLIERAILTGFRAPHPIPSSNSSSIISGSISTSAPTATSRSGSVHSSA